MNSKWLILLFAVSLGNCKVNNKPLTESMGQEVIEIGAPLKELPPDLDEEPAAELDDTSTAITLQATKIKQSTTKPTNKMLSKNTKHEENEARIEKELAEMYKDTDYTADNEETSKEPSQEPSKETSQEPTHETSQEPTQETSQETSQEPSQETPDEAVPVGRSRNNFKFQPDANNAKAIAKFRTSVDEISCERNGKLSGTTSLPNSGFKPGQAWMGVPAFISIYKLYLF